MLNEAQVLGVDVTHIESDASGLGMHPDCRAALLRLQAQAAQQGFDLQVASGFRSYERQLAIWNAKASGERPVFDEAGRALDIAVLTQEELLHAILRFSALPGTSRHHWGTDLDVYDAAAVASDYQVQLSAAEVTGTGVFCPMHDWLDARMAAGNCEGFFRPYDRDRGGVAPERWHLSYRPLAEACVQVLSLPLIEAHLRDSELVLKDKLLDLLPEIYQRYVLAL
jgi:LAS superfamily LD-carboxypeptidase LdcB